MTKPQILSLAIALALVPGIATASAAAGSGASFALGVEHPLTHLDHMLVMVAVGLLGAQLGGRALWLMPATFVTLCAAGGAIGLAGYGLPFVEIGVAISVLALGVLIAAQLPLPTGLTVGMVAAFALFHGHAHGAEAPLGVSAAGYMAGFVTATAVLHGAGLALGRLLQRQELGWARRAVRFGGGSMALAGVAMVGGLF
jgi:urease accessory protein